MSGSTATLVVARRKFVSALNECVNDGIRNILGQSTLDAVLSKMQLASLADTPGEIHNGFDRIFGAGAKILEKVMVKDLFKRLDLKYEELVSFDFETYVNFARREFSMTWLKEGGIKR